MVGGAESSGYLLGLLHYPCCKDILQFPIEADPVDELFLCVGQAGHPVAHAIAT